MICNGLVVFTTFLSWYVFILRLYSNKWFNKVDDISKEKIQIKANIFYYILRRHRGQMRIATHWDKSSLFLSFVCIFITVRDPVIKRGGVGIQLTGLTPPHVCACPFYVFSEFS